MKTYAMLYHQSMISNELQSALANEKNRAQKRAMFIQVKERCAELASSHSIDHDRCLELHKGSHLLLKLLKFQMTLNKIHYDFELTNNGWLALPPTEEDALRGVVGTKVVVRVTEHSDDDKPDIWYKSQILNLCDDEEERIEAIAKLQKLGMPELLKQKCSGYAEPYVLAMIDYMRS